METNHCRKIKRSNMSHFITLFKLHIKLETSSIILSESRSVVSDSLQPLGLYSPWNSPGQNTRVDKLSLLQGIFPTQLFPDYSKSKGKKLSWTLPLPSSQHTIVVKVMNSGIRLSDISFLPLTNM